MMGTHDVLELLPAIDDRPDDVVRTNQRRRNEQPERVDDGEVDVVRLDEPLHLLL